MIPRVEPGGVLFGKPVSTFPDRALRGRPDAAIGSGLGALMRCRRQGGSFGAEPSARRLLRLAAILGTEASQRFVKFRIALTGSFGNDVPFKTFDLVHRHALAVYQHPR